MTECGELSHKNSQVDAEDIPADSLLVMPVRYALMSLGDRASVVRALDVEAPDAASLSPDTAYTTRHLRSGYLYIYEETMKRWSMFKINDNKLCLGNLIGVASDYDSDYTRETKPRISKAGDYLVISNTNYFNKVWFGFSDYQWTPGTYGKNEDTVYRARHMRVLDVQAALKGSSQPHVGRMDDIENIVSEYVIPRKAEDKSFDHSPFKFRSYQDKHPVLMDKLKHCKGGVILALRDPVGIANELRSMMQHKEREFDKLHRHEIFTNARITSIRNYVLTKARDDIEERKREVEERKREVEYALKNLPDERSREVSLRVPGATGSAPYPDHYQRGVRRSVAEGEGGGIGGVVGINRDALDRVNNIFSIREENFRDKLDELNRELNRFENEDPNEQWDKFLQWDNGKSKTRYDEDARVYWVERYKAKKKDFTKRHITPLAQAHAAWMKSEQCANYFICNFDSSLSLASDHHLLFDDTSTLNTGKGYVDTLFSCIGDTQNREPCCELYKTWCLSDKDDNRNLLMRGLCFNSDEIANYITSLVSAPPAATTKDESLGDNEAGVNAAKAPKEFAKLMAKYVTQPGHKDVLSRLIRSVFGPMMGGFSDVKTTEGKSVSPRFIATINILISAEGKAIREVILKGSEKDFSRLVTSVIKELADRSPLKKEQITNTLNNYSVRKIKSKSGAIIKEYRIHVMMPVEVATTSPSPTLKVSEYEAIVKEELGVLGQAHKVVGLALLVALILQSVAFYSYGEEAWKPMSHDRAEAELRAFAASLTLLGLVADLADHVYPLSPSTSSALIKGMAKGFGIVGGVLMAMADLKASYENFVDGNEKATYLYLGAAVVGVSLATLSYTGLAYFGPYGWIALAFLVAFGMWLSYYAQNAADSKLQNWLERCYLWGNTDYVDQRYRTIERSAEEFERATAG